MRNNKIKLKKDKIKKFIRWAKRNAGKVIKISGPKLVIKFGISKTTVNRIKAEFNIQTKGRIKPKVQFCPRGHDTFIVGRDRHLRCIKCVQIDHPLKRGAQFKKICSKGHDKDIIGRASDGHCKECVSLERKRYYNQHRKQLLKLRRKYAQSHPAVYRLASLRVNAKRKLRIPKWGQKGIIKFYNNCPQNMTVDHIVPLCGKKVSGLHVRWNLQYLTPTKNARKTNKIDLIKASIRYGKLLEKLGLK